MCRRKPVRRPFDLMAASIWREEVGVPWPGSRGQITPAVCTPRSGSPRALAVHKLHDVSGAGFPAGWRFKNAMRHRARSNACASPTERGTWSGVSTRGTLDQLRCPGVFQGLHRQLVNGVAQVRHLLAQGLNLRLEELGVHPDHLLDVLGLNDLLGSFEGRQNIF
jgi:hypothetical protein